MEVWLMRMWTSALALGMASLVVVTPALADRQRLAPGTGTQDAIVIDTGDDGICDTTAAKGDIQLTEVGSGAEDANAVRCGPNQIAESVAGGDDTQAIAVGADCQNANSTAVRTGPNGIVETALAGDDTYVNGLVFGAAPPNTPCVITGANGIADTSPPGGDDPVELLVGQAEPNTDVVRCGPNLVADTSANNVDAGDDVQVVALGDPCNNQNDVVVDSGADGVAATRAEGPDLRLDTVKPIRITIKKGKREAAKRLRISIRNVEFGDAAPSSRGYRIEATRGNCPRPTILAVDADAKAAGDQATGNVRRKGRAKATVTVRARLEEVTTADKKNPERCTFNVELIALDTDPDPDDGANPRGNRAVVQLETIDKNDL
jgi:hypothetical protein